MARARALACQRFSAESPPDGQPGSPVPAASSVAARPSGRHVPDVRERLPRALLAHPPGDGLRRLDPGGRLLPRPQRAAARPRRARASPRRSLGGIFTWTMAEYVLHRWVFHWTNDTPWGKRIHFLLHGVHHDFPNDKDRLVMPLPTSVPLAVIFYSLFYLHARAHAGRAVLRRLRHRLPLLRRHPLLRAPLLADVALGKFLRRHHMTHHFADHDGGFGVSSPLWDYVFRTLPAKKKCGTKRRKTSRATRPARGGDDGGAEARKDVFVALAAVAWADGSSTPTRRTPSCAPRSTRGCRSRRSPRSRQRPRTRSTSASSTGPAEQGGPPLRLRRRVLDRPHGRAGDAPRRARRSRSSASSSASPSARACTPRPSPARSPRCPRATAPRATIWRPLRRILGERLRGAQAAAAALRLSERSPPDPIGACAAG